MRLIRFLLIFILSLTVLMPGANEAYAKKRSHKRASSAGYNPKYSDLVVNADTGKILHDGDSNALRYPASLTKMMTLYLLFEKLHAGKISLHDTFYVSAEAASRPQTNLSLTPGDKIGIEDVIHALIIRSANDVAVVTAENLASSESEFAKIMNARARQLGMKKTTFKNASGLHHPGQISTARDLALLGIAIKKHFPEYYHYFDDTEFSFRGRTYSTHNRVTLNYAGADGLKTGFVTASGFNLVTSATRRNTNLIGVVLGGRSGATRDRRMMALLDDGFAKSANDKFSQDNNPKKYDFSANTNTAPPQGDTSDDDGLQQKNNNSSAGDMPATASSYNTAQAILNQPKATDQVVQKITTKKIQKKKSVKPKKKKLKKKYKKKATAKVKPSPSSPVAQSGPAN